jgi:terminase small subunit / prophage DNA-packing protein
MARTERVPADVTLGGPPHPDISADEKKPNGEQLHIGEASTVAKYLGVNTRTVYRLAEEGHVIKVAPGRFDVALSASRYCAHLRAVAAGRGGEKGVLDLTAERARLAKEQADAQSLKNEAARGALIPAGEVTAKWRGILTGVRSLMLAVPSRVRVAIPHLTAAEIEAVDREIRNALTEASRAGD